MEYTDFGAKVNVSNLQFGCSRLGKAVQEDTTDIAHDILNQAYEAGINTFDTAANYAYGNSEIILGEWAQNKRDKLFLVTKGGTMISKKAASVRFLSPFYSLLRPIVRKSNALKKHGKRFNFDHSYLTETLDTSLSRLKTEYVDLYLLHNPQDYVLSNRKTNELLGRFKKEGKATLTGYSLNKMEHLELLSFLDHIDVLQLPINYYNYEPWYRDEVLKLKAKGIKIITRAPFERGLLTPYNQKKTGGKSGEIDASFRAKKALMKKEFSLSETQMALWFLRDLGLSDSILFSSFTADHLRENIEVMEEKMNENFSWQDLPTSET